MKKHSLPESIPPTPILSHKKQRNFLAISIILVYPLLFVLAMGLLRSGNLFTENIFQYAGLLGGFKVLFLELLFFCLLSLMAMGLLKNIFTGYLLVSVCFFLFYLANYYRTTITGLVLTPADFAFAPKLGSILSFLRPRLDAKSLLSFLLVFAGLAGVFFCKKAVLFPFQMDLQNRALLFLVPLVVVYFGFFTRFSQTALVCFLGVKPAAFQTYPNTLYSKHGVLLGFYLLSQQEQLLSLAQAQAGEQPVPLAPLTALGDPEFEDTYSQAYMNYILANVTSKIPPADTALPNAEKPNVLVILSEAFWDPTRMENLSLSADPIPHFRALSQTHPSGNIITPVFGGVTCNVEYELLTGNPLYFSNNSTVPFEDPATYLPQADPKAIPRQFQKNGYKTLAISPFYASFYNRNLLYPRLGFEEYISSESMPSAPKKGGMISDEYFTSRIIQAIEETEEPLFLYGVSAQNHYAYAPGKYEQTHIRATSPALPILDRKSTESYLEGLRDADEQLARLLEYLEQQTRPTIVFFFGDHLPLIGNYATDLYSRLGYTSARSVSDWSVQDRYNMYSTPYLLWANYTLPNYPLQDMSSFYIGPVLLHLAGLQKSIYSSYMLQTYEQIHALHPYVYVNQDASLSALPLQQDQAWLSNLYYINYDEISTKNTPTTGRRYITDLLAEPAP